MFNIQVFNSESTHNDDLYSQVYELTNHISASYPSYKKWFFETFLPDLKAGNRIILALFNDSSELIGTALLKKAIDEHKICTLFTRENYREYGIGDRLMQASVDELKRADIHLSVSGTNLEQLNNLLLKYNFELIGQSSGDYLPEETEHYFIRKASE